MKSKLLVYTAAGYVIALLTGGFLPEAVSLLLPAAGAAAALYTGGRRVDGAAGQAPAVRGAEAAPLPASAQAPASAVTEAGRAAAPRVPAGGSAAAETPAAGRPDANIAPEFAPVVEYLVVLEDMIISEGQKNSLDNEIVDKALALFARLQRVIPLLQELGNGEINHTVRRLVMKDLNGVINPFLRLGGEAKMRNRRTLLNGLKDVDSKISDIASTIEHKDLLELQTKAELIHQRYSRSEL